MRVLLVTTDLMVSSHVEGAAKRQAAALEVVACSDAINRIAEGVIDIIAVDLSTLPSDSLNALRQLRTHCPAETKLLAFGPHVHKAKLDAARAAGFDLVLSRGEFHVKVDQLLAG